MRGISRAGAVSVPVGSASALSSASRFSISTPSLLTTWYFAGRQNGTLLSGMATPPLAAQVVCFAVFEVDLRTGDLRKHGVRIKLQDQPFKILAMLLEHPGELVTREQIKQKLWPADTYVDFEHSVNAAVRRLRNVLGDDAEIQRFVETVPRRGYRFIAPVNTSPTRACFDVAGRPQEFSSATRADGPQPEDPPPTTFRSRWLLAATIAVVLLAALTGWRFWPHDAAVDSVAVLPFANQTSDPNLDYLADGIAASVTDSLSEMTQLRVISRNSAFTYRQQPVNTGRAAADLRVRALVLGALRRDGDKLQVSVELIDARDDRHLWGERYDTDTAHIAAVQSRIAEEVSRNLRQQTTPEVRHRIAQRQPSNGVAYDAYLRGRYLFNRRLNANFQAALQYFQAAIDADPNFALAYAGMASAYALLAYYGGMDAAEALRLQEVAVDRALELDPNLALAHFSKGVNLMSYHRDLDGAEHEMRRAIALDPNLTEAHDGYARVLASMGRIDEAIAESKRAQELDPLSPASVNANTMMLYQAKRFDEAIQLRRKSPALNPAHWWYGTVNAAAGRRAEALAELDQVPSNASPLVRCWAAQGYAMAGQAERARAVLADTLRQQKEQGSATTQYCSPYEIAGVYAVLGERALMFEYLRIADTQLDPRLREGIRSDPPLDRYRSDPEFIAFFKRVSQPR
jgi:TolB-like protein/DNA-binding winged helix-turn-helix (wHTH) protein/tetratricopeptide (TPR) repeat protein